MRQRNFIMTGILLGTLVIGSCTKDNLTPALETSAPDEFAKFSSNLGAVCTMDNSPDGNHVILYKRSPLGKLNKVGEFGTGGTGTGEGLGTQGSIVTDNNFFFVVNAGSSEISVLKAGAQGLIFVEKVASNGTKPVSLTVNGHWLYVVNKGSANIGAFNIDGNGHLTFIPGSDRPLSSTAADPGQISFNQSGTQVVVTEKATNIIMTYDIDANGMPSAGESHQSAGETPFGFDFGVNDQLIISNAADGILNSSSVTSYTLTDEGALTVNDGPVGTTETSACWLKVTNSGQYAYCSNTGSASVTGYSVDNSGSLTLLNGNGITGATGQEPIDIDLTTQSDFLYVLNSGSKSITIFKVETNGQLTNLGDMGGLPAGASGLAAL